jgi:TctA family transporter
VFISPRAPLKGLVSLFLGLLVACVGLSNPAAFPRFTFGSVELMGGIGLIPLMIGMFAISEIIRYVVDTDPQPMIVDRPIGNVFKGMWRLTSSTRCRSCAAARSARCRRAARRRRRHRRWMSYAMSKSFSKEPEKFGTGHVEGIVESARPTTARSPAPGSRRSCSAFRRLDHRDRDRRALHEEHEPGPRSSSTTRRTSTRSTCCSSSRT